jgi:hypothetical protein
MTAAIDSSSPIVGAASLTLTSTASTQIGYLTPTDVSGLAKGLEQGRLRTLVQPKSSSGNGYGFGLVCMGSADNIGTINGQFYRFEFLMSGSYSLTRGDFSTLSNVSATPLITASTTLTQNTVYGMQIEWIVDLTNIGGIYFALKKGTAINFSDLALLTQLTDGSEGKLVSSNNEGVYLRGYLTATNAIVSFDQTQLYNLG